MRVLIWLLLAVGLAILPFVWLKRPWAIRLWRRVRILFVVYAAVILASAIFGLSTRWGDIY